MSHFTPEEIEAVILETLDEYQYDEHVTPASINRGECEAFAETVNERLDNSLEIITTADITGADPDAKPEPWHVWLSDGEQNYDAEHPQGVESWAQLNFFHRTITKTPNL